ncbi:MAG: hypothetical protein IOD12_04330 [Silvanigrellales bacterium]|nr:hypothetical protein [Silvanigrellales bacterium]
MTRQANGVEAILESLPTWKRRQETGRLLRLLSSQEEGFCKETLLEAYYDDYARSSVLRRTALQARLGKLLQRTRARFHSHGVQVKFDVATRRWSAVVSTVEVLNRR